MRRQYTRRNVGPTSPIINARQTEEKKAKAKELRHNMTEPEKMLWQRLRGNQLGVPFRRQSVLFGYIADFWCPACAIDVEVDGKFHEEKKEQDRQRDCHIQAHGVLVLRIPARDVYNHIEEVVGLIHRTVNRRLRQPYRVKA